MNRKQQLDLATRAWGALPYLAGISWADGAERLLAATVAEERKHRKNAPLGYHSTRIKDAAKLLAVHDLACAIARPLAATWESFLTCRPSWLIARGLAEVNRDAIVKAWAAVGLKPEDICPLDYASFVNKD